MSASGMVGLRGFPGTPFSGGVRQWYGGNEGIPWESLQSPGDLKDVQWSPWCPPVVWWD